MINIDLNNKTAGLILIQGNYYRNMFINNPQTTNIQQQNYTLYNFADLKLANLEIRDDIYRNVKTYQMINIQSV